MRRLLRSLWMSAVALWVWTLFLALGPPLPEAAALFALVLWLSLGALCLFCLLLTLLCALERWALRGLRRSRHPESERR